MDLAWGIMDDIAERIRTNKRPECINLPTAELFDLLRPAQLYEGRFDEVLFELATKYWRTATTLATYDPKALTDAVLVATERFPALMPGLGHEVLLADKIVEPSRVQPVT
jgi:hypothetical protein